MSADVPDRRYGRTPATAPGPSGPQMAKAFLDIRRNPLAFLETMRDRYGSIVQFPIPMPPTYLVADPDAARRVLVGNARSYGKRTLQYRALSLVTGEGLLTADTDVWRNQRRVVQPAFHHRAIEAVVGHAATAGERLADRWLAGGSTTRIVDIDPGVMAAAMEVVGSSLFGSDLSREADDLAEATLAALDIVIARARVPVSPPSWVPTPGNVRLRRSVRTLDEAVARLIVHRRAQPRRDDADPDLLDLLMASAVPGRAGIIGIRDQVVTFVVAGHETVASAMGWALWLLAGDASARAQVESEIDRVLGDRAPGIADIADLTWTSAVFDEALRLFPPAWLLTRRALAEDRLGGRSIPAGSLVILSPYLVHRDPEVWPEPARFRPERFVPGADDGPHVRRDEAYWPFGAGPRLCIGRDFARLEAVAMLAVLLRRVRVERVPGLADPVARPLVTIRPEAGLPLRVVSRRA